METHPDTTITFVYGKTMVVTERPEEVVARIMDYRRAIASFGAAD